MKQQSIEYSDGDTVFEAFVAQRDEGRCGSPTVLLLHHWAGQTSETHAIAVDVAQHGYVVIALDVYGKGRRGTTPEECNALMTPLIADRSLLARRFVALPRPHSDAMISTERSVVSNSSLTRSTRATNSQSRESCRSSP